MKRILFIHIITVLLLAGCNGTKLAEKTLDTALTQIETQANNHKAMELALLHNLRAKETACRLAQAKLALAGGVDASAVLDTLGQDANGFQAFEEAYRGNLETLYEQDHMTLAFLIATQSVYIQGNKSIFDLLAPQVVSGMASLKLTATNSSTATAQTPAATTQPVNLESLLESIGGTLTRPEPVPAPTTQPSGGAP